jgi:hypothetical protein
VKDLGESEKRVVKDYAKRILDKITVTQGTYDGELKDDEIEDEREISSVGGMVF